MLQILNWDFKGKKNAVESSKRGLDVYCGEIKPESNFLGRSECILVQVCCQIYYPLPQTSCLERFFYDSVCKNRPVNRLAWTLEQSVIEFGMEMIYMT